MHKRRSPEVSKRSNQGSEVKIGTMTTSGCKNVVEISAPKANEQEGREAGLSPDNQSALNLQRNRKGKCECKEAAFPARGGEGLVSNVA